MLTMHRLFAVIKFSSQSYSFATNLSKSLGPAIQNLNEFPDKQIDEAIEKTPELQKFTKDQWRQSYDTFVGQGFYPSNFMRIIRRRPQLLKRSSDKLLESIECLRETQFGDESIIELVEQHPELLDPAKIIQNKMDYLTNVMKVDETDASKSHVFSHSLEEIKCRHVFLSRLGMFKPKNPKVDKLQPSRNPKMSSIFDTSDRDFACRTCGVTLEEFETFRELYKREKDRYEDEDEEDVDEKVDEQ